MIRSIRLYRRQIYAYAYHRPKLDFVRSSTLDDKRTGDTALLAAALIIPAVGNNKLRHETLQKFILANDSVTVAIEIPIWLTEDDIDALERLGRKRMGPYPLNSQPHCCFVDMLVELMDA